MPHDGTGKSFADRGAADVHLLTDTENTGGDNVTRLEISQLIDTDQAWGVKVDWEMHGILAKFLNATFELRILLESIGPGAELALPATVVEVDTLSAPWVGGQRVYSRKITIAAGTVPAGAYKLVTLLQLYDHANPGAKPYPVAGMVEGPIVNFFNS